MSDKEKITTPDLTDEAPAAPAKSFLSGLVGTVKKAMDELGNAAEEKTLKMKEELNRIPGGSSSTVSYDDIEKKLGATPEAPDASTLRIEREERARQAQERLLGGSTSSSELMNPKKKS